MARRWIVITLLLVGLGLVGCTGQEPSPDASGQNSSSPPADSPAGGTQLAPGLYDLEDGSVQAVGTLEYSDLEGGFWLITGGTASEGNVGETVAVIANGGDFTSELEALRGKSVIAKGKRLDGASIRMAGPEIEIESIEEMSATPGPAY